MHKVHIAQLRELLQQGLLHKVQGEVLPAQGQVPEHVSTEHHGPAQHPGVPGDMRAGPLERVEHVHQRGPHLRLQVGPGDAGARRAGGPQGGRGGGGGGVPGPAGVPQVPDEEALPWREERSQEEGEEGEEAEGEGGGRAGGHRARGTRVGGGARLQPPPPPPPRPALPANCFLCRNSPRLAAAAVAGAPRQLPAAGSVQGPRWAQTGLGVPTLLPRVVGAVASRTRDGPGATSSPGSVPAPRLD